MNYSFSIPPTFDPSSNWVAKETLLSWLRVDTSEETIVFGLLWAAMYAAEEECKQPLFQREYTAKLACFTNGTIPAFVIDEGSLAVTYIQEGSTESQTLAPTGYSLLNGSLTFSDDTLAMTGITSVTIKVKLGFTPEALPDNIRLALQLMVSDYYDNRANGVKQLPTAAQSLLAHYKRFTC